MSDFKWAHGRNANIKEPIANLKENGWQYADIPTASNFNWLFKSIGEELAAQKASFDSQIKTLSKEIESHTRTINEQKQLLASAMSTVQNLDRQCSALHKALTHLIAVNILMVTAINNRISTSLRSGYPFRYTDGGLPEPVRDIRFDTITGEPILSEETSGN